MATQEKSKAAEAALPLDNFRAAQARKRLHLQWVIYVAVCIVAFWAGFFYMRGIWGLDYAMRWFQLGGWLMAYQLFALHAALKLNYREGEGVLLPRLGWGTTLSLARGLIIALLAGLLLTPRLPGLLAWAPAILYIGADFADFFDGYVARVTKHDTKLGEALDLNLDGLGVLVVTLLAFQYGTVPWWYLPVGFARYLFVFGIWWRKRGGKPVYELQPSVARRGLAGVQMGFVTAMLFPIFSPPGTTIAATIFMLPFLGGFWYDWLSVSGGLRPESPGSTQLWGKAWHFLTEWAPLGLRGLAAVVLVTWVAQMVSSPGTQAAHYASLGMPNSGIWVLVLAGLEGLIAIFILLGIDGRGTSVIGLLLAGTRLQYDDFGGGYWLLMLSYIGLLFLGSGRYSLWQPWEWLIRNRAGERSGS